MTQNILYTKITPPPNSPRILLRPRITQVLRQSLDYRLSILQAEAGYGKSTSLAALVDDVDLLAWYQIYEEDSDPLVFLMHVCHSLLRAVPSLTDLPFQMLEAWDGTQGPLPWRGVLDRIINTLSTQLDAPLLLVLDDAHLIMEMGDVVYILDRLISLAPANLHIFLSGRPEISLPSLSRLRIQGDVLSLEQPLLLFSAEEISALFSNHYELELSGEEVESVNEYTEGWAIALQLIWQNIRGQASSTIEFPLRRDTQSLDALFDMLAEEVFERQPEDVRDFLLITSTLRDLRPEVCDALRMAVGAVMTDSASMLAYLRRQDLFVVETAGGIFRYHNIFHHFLRQRTKRAQRQTWSHATAHYFHTNGNAEAAIYHLLEAKAWDEVANLLDDHAPTLLKTGLLDTLASYLDALPPETLHEHPALVFMLGELARLHSRFDEAQGWYKQAETIWRLRGQKEGIARSLRGQARVYLDTVNPTKAEELLEEAILLSDGFENRESQVRLFELLAENKLNAGQVDEAERLRQRAENLRLEGPSNDQLWFRVLMRTGRLTEARSALEKSAISEAETPIQTPRAHRETLLLLSLVYSFSGIQHKAYETALQGTLRGDQLKSPYVSAVGFMRQGHALMLKRGPDDLFEHYSASREMFEKSIEHSRNLEVPRLAVEANWGLCRASGYQGDLIAAQSYAQAAITTADRAGDEWVSSMVRVTMGASLMLAQRYDAAEEWLSRALLGFQECSDAFGLTAARLWLSHGLLKQKRFEQLAPLLPELLTKCRTEHYDFLFTGSSLLGAPDERIFIPLLLYAREQGIEPAYINQLLEALGLPDLQLHPGYHLRVQTLRAFQVWRGNERIPARGWKREKAKQLFQLLLTYRHKALDRDQICDHLWRDAEPATAQRNFKIALNTLYQVLEPDREPGSDSSYILRNGTRYSLRPEADIWLDAEDFIKKASLGSSPDFGLVQDALALYRGEYLPDALYEPWAAEERERLNAIFLESADALTEHFIATERYTDAIELSQRILAQDNCWERAYRHQMLAYDALGDRGQVGRAYQRCVQVLHDELDVSPAPETEELYRKLTQQASHREY